MKDSERASLKLKIKKKKKLRSWCLSPLLHGKQKGKGASSDRIPLLGFEIIVDCDCSHEIRKQLLLGRKVMTNLDSVLKSRDITWPTKVRIATATVFPGYIW